MNNFLLALRLDDIRGALKFYGPLNIQGIQDKLYMRDIEANYLQIKQGLKSLEKQGLIKACDAIGFYKYIY